VRSLLMGGQACVLYGGAEFSRDTDILVVADPANLARLQAAVDELQADVIAVPPSRAASWTRATPCTFAAGIRKRPACGST